MCLCGSYVRGTWEIVVKDASEGLIKGESPRKIQAKWEVRPGGLVTVDSSQSHSSNWWPHLQIAYWLDVVVGALNVLDTCIRPVIVIVVSIFCTNIKFHCTVGRITYMRATILS